MKYQNPIIKGFHPDPSICRVDDTFYLVNSSFQFLPGVPIFSSKDLVNWMQLGHCLTRPSQLDMTGVECSMGIFAPTIRYHQGKFYMITTNVSLKDKSGKLVNFIVSTEDPLKGWSDPVVVDIEGIDPSFFFENGKTYIQYAILGRGIGQVEVNLETGELLSDIVIITTGSGGRDVEGPHMYRIGDYYYLLTAEGGTREGHMVTIRRGNSVWGPFEECPANPILTNRDQSRQLLQNVGHADLVDDAEGNWWLVALAVRSVKRRHHLGRETILMPVTWNEEGWPVVSKGYAEIEMEVESLQESKQLNMGLEKDDFNSDILGLKWNSLREFINDLYSLTERPGFLALKASKDSLNDLGTTSFIGRRQEDFECEVITKMEFNPTKPYEEAGITIFGDRNHHFDLFLRDNKVVLRKTVSDMVIENAEYANGNTRVYFKVSASKFEYKFFYSFDNINYSLIDESYTRHLAIEVIDSKFAGAYIGMYATGNGQDTDVKAYFDFFSYENKE